MQNYPHQPWGQGQNQYPRQQGQGAWGWGGAVQTQSEAGAERLAFIRKVYGLFGASVLLSAIGAMIALYVGGEVVVEGGIRVPTIVAMVGGMHWLLRLGLIFGVVLGANALRKVQGLNVVALFGMSFLLGILFAPSLFVAQLIASTGGTVSASPIRDAFILATLMFGGLTGYVAVSKKDFSYLGSALSMGFLVILGAIVLNIFLGSEVVSLAIATVGLILFGGYVLYDTSRILRSQERDAVGGAMQLYMDFLNIFLFLLRLLSSRR